MKNNIAQRLNSDSAAAMSTETILIIALAVFAALALFTGVLRPVRENADGLGKGLTGFFDDLITGANTEGGGQDIEFKFDGRK